MKNHPLHDKWRALGWKSPFWELVRYYLSLTKSGQKQFLRDLDDRKARTERWWDRLGMKQNVPELLNDYCVAREKLKLMALADLRTEEAAISYCRKKKIKWAVTKTRSKDHHQSSKTIIATVNAIASKVCRNHSETLDPNPQARCVWSLENHLHVTARELDGAIPSLQDPYIVWEIKEYWGKTGGGSKMSDAVYECQLVGRELREFEGRSGHRISHVVFLDGKNQWMSRKSDLARFIDLHNQGLIDHLFIGRKIESDWEPTLTELVRARKSN